MTMIKYEVSSRRREYLLYQIETLKRSNDWFGFEKDNTLSKSCCFSSWF
ncbi:hypothetical protein [Candidatus Nitrosocosmicus sp. FF01]